jgi:hypothetical protein
MISVGFICCKINEYIRSSNGFLCCTGSPRLHQVFPQSRTVSRHITSLQGSGIPARLSPVDIARRRGIFGHHPVIDIVTFKSPSGSDDGIASGILERGNRFDSGSFRQSLSVFLLPLCGLHDGYPESGSQCGSQLLPRYHSQDRARRSSPGQGFSDGAAQGTSQGTPHMGSQSRRNRTSQNFSEISSTDGCRSSGSCRHKPRIPRRESDRHREKIHC